MHTNIDADGNRHDIMFVSKTKMIPTKSTKKSRNNSSGLRSGVGIEGRILAETPKELGVGAFSS